jgi:hypothetical protein
MAFKTNKSDKGAFNATTSTTTQNQQSKDQVSAPIIANLFSKYGATGSLSAEANEYVNNIRAILEDKTNPIQIEAKKLTKPAGSLLFKSGEYGIILIFEELHNPDIMSILKNQLIFTALADVQENYKGLKVLNTVIVTKHDYKKYMQMSNYINRCLMIYNDPTALELNINSFGDMRSLVIEPNMDIVKNSFESNSPHGIMARHDIGFTCYLVSKMNRHDALELADKQELFSCIGYTEVVPNNTGQGMKFAPVIHVSDIIAPFMTPRLLPLISGVTAETFAAYRLWQLPYRNLKKGAPNIGNYTIDPKTNKPITLKTEQEVNIFFSEYFTEPVIVFDVTEGRARIPGLALFTINNFRSQLVTEFSKFFNAEIQDPSGVQIVNGTPSVDIVGYTEIKGLVSGEDIIDTRYVDYLNVLNMIGYEERVSQLFWKYGLDPIKRCELLRSITSNIRFTHLNYEVILNGHILEDVVSMLSQHIHIINPVNNQLTQSIDIRNLLSNSYGSGPIMGGRRTPIPTPTWNNNFYGIV